MRKDEKKIEETAKTMNLRGGRGRVLRDENMEKGQRKRGGEKQD